MTNLTISPADRVATFLTLDNARKWEASTEQFTWVIYNILDLCELPSSDRNVNYVEQRLQVILTNARNFRAELDAAAAAGDWAAHETIWEERRQASVAHDEASILTLQSPVPTDEQVRDYLTGYYPKHYEAQHAIAIGATHPSTESDLALDVNVYVAFADGGDEVHSWTVWIEDLGDGPFVYGEW